MRALEETLRQIFPLDSTEEETWRSRLAAETGKESVFAAARFTARLAGIGRGPIHPHKPLLAVFTAGHGIARKRTQPEVPPTEPARTKPSSAQTGVVPATVPVMPVQVLPVPTIPAFIVDMGGSDDFGQASANLMLVKNMRAEVTLLSRPVAASCADIARGPAMSIAMAREAVETGIALAEEWRRYDLFAIACQGSHQGRGVLYAASAIAVRCLGDYQESDLPAGVEAALLTEILSAACDGKTGLELLAAVGGFDLGGAAGLMLALAARRQPIVLADFAATAAALLAARLEPFIRDYLFAVTAECPLHQAALTLLGGPVGEPLPASGQSLEESLATLIAASSLFIEADRA